IDDREQILERSACRKTFEIGPETGVAGRRQLAANVNLRRGVFSDEHDPQARRTSPARPKRLHAGGELGAALAGHHRASEPPGRHTVGGCTARRLNDAGWPSTTSLSPGRIVHSGSGLNSILWSSRWMPTTMTPNRWRRSDSTSERCASDDPFATKISSIA